jgi:prepilin-type N-terminal cleavage/methylation domain-containing protein
MDVMQGLSWTCHPRESGGPEPRLALWDSRLRGNDRPCTAGFTLLEVLAALAILALASSSVLVVIDRCVSSASNSSLRREAFELARENLEKILISDTVEETVDYGTSDRYPDISWQTIVESFPEPVTGEMWVRAVCSAQYVDATGEKRAVELVRWLCPLTDQQAELLVDQKELEQLELEQVLRTDEEAADYAKVDTDTLRKWIENGLIKTAEGAFLKYNLDVFVQAKGDPTPEQKAEQVESVQKLAMKLRTQENGGEPQGAEPKGPTGLSNRELEKLSPDQIRELVNPESRLR